MNEEELLAQIEEATRLILQNWDTYTPEQQAEARQMLEQFDQVVTEIETGRQEAAAAEAPQQDEASTLSQIEESTRLILQNWDTYTPEQQQEARGLLEQYDQIVREIEAQQATTPTPGAPITDRVEQFPTQPIGADAPIPNDAYLLWILAGGNKDAFLNYLQQYQTEETQALLADPQRLEMVMGELERFVPSPPPEEEDGVPKADLQSSNVYGADYDPQTGKLRVRFQRGQIYDYDNVPFQIASAFMQGDAAAKTDGQNEFGVWWQGKSPSLGASVHQFLREGGFPYQRVA